MVCVYSYQLAYISAYKLHISTYNIILHHITAYMGQFGHSPISPLSTP